MCAAIATLVGPRATMAAAGSTTALSTPGGFGDEPVRCQPASGTAPAMIGTKYSSVSTLVPRWSWGSSCVRWRPQRVVEIDQLLVSSASPVRYGEGPRTEVAGCRSGFGPVGPRWPGRRLRGRVHGCDWRTAARGCTPGSCGPGRSNGGHGRCAVGWAVVCGAGHTARVAPWLSRRASKVVGSRPRSRRNPMRRRSRRCCFDNAARRARSAALICSRWVLWPRAAIPGDSRPVTGPVGALVGPVAFWGAGSSASLCGTVFLGVCCAPCLC
jgi:hypothetical protein